MHYKALSPVILVSLVSLATAEDSTDLSAITSQALAAASSAVGTGFTDISVPASLSSEIISDVNTAAAGTNMGMPAGASSFIPSSVSTSVTATGTGMSMSGMIMSTSMSSAASGQSMSTTTTAKSQGTTKGTKSVSTSHTTGGVGAQATAAAMAVGAGVLGVLRVAAIL